MAEVLSTVQVVTHCARCGQNHCSLTFKKFSNPVRILEEKLKSRPFRAIPETILYTHWALCPLNGEPILMRFVARAASNVPDCCGGNCGNKNVTSEPEVKETKAE